MLLPFTPKQGSLSSNANNLRHSEVMLLCFIMTGSQLGHQSKMWVYLQQISIKNLQQQLFLLWLVVTRVSVCISPFRKGSCTPWLALQDIRCIGSEMPSYHPEHKLQIQGTLLASRQWPSIRSAVRLIGPVYHTSWESSMLNMCTNRNLALHDYWRKSHQQMFI